MGDKSLLLSGKYPPPPPLTWDLVCPPKCSGSFKTWLRTPCERSSQLFTVKWPCWLHPAGVDRLPGWGGWGGEGFHSFFVFYWVSLRTRGAAERVLEGWVLCHSPVNCFNGQFHVLNLGGIFRLQLKMPPSCWWRKDRNLRQSAGKVPAGSVRCSCFICLSAPRG